MRPFEPDDLGALNGASEALRRLAEESDLTQEEIAQRIGISRSAVSRILHGRDRPRLETLGRLLKYGLGLSMVDFVEVLLDVQGQDSSEVIHRHELEDALRLLHLRLRVGTGESPSEPSSDQDEPEST